MESTIDESRDVTVTDMGEAISVFVPISWKRTGGRKQIILPDGIPSAETVEDKLSPLAIALARAYVWQHWIDEGTYANAKELAQDIGVHPTLVGRMLRLSRLSPHIVEEALDGNEPDVSLQALLDMDVPVGWVEQEDVFGGESQAAS